MTEQEALIKLRMRPEFAVVMEALLDRRPSLLLLVPSKDLQEQATKLLYETGRRQGFDDLVNYLRGNDEWQNRNN